MSDDYFDLQPLLDRPIAYHRVFVDVTGSVATAVFLSQALYWHRRVPVNRDGWFFKSNEQWSHETGLTRHNIQTARKTLQELGIMDFEMRSFPRRAWYRLNIEVLRTTLLTCQNRQWRNDGNNEKSGVLGSTNCNRENSTNCNPGDSEIQTLKGSLACSPEGLANSNLAHSTNFNREDTKNSSLQDSTNSSLEETTNSSLPHSTNCSLDDSTNCNVLAAVKDLLNSASELLNRVNNLLDSTLSLPHTTNSSLRDPANCSVQDSTHQSAENRQTDLTEITNNKLKYNLSSAREKKLFPVDNFSPSEQDGAYFKTLDLPDPFSLVVAEFKLYHRDCKTPPLTHDQWSKLLRGWCDVRAHGLPAHSVERMRYQEGDDE